MEHRSRSPEIIRSDVALSGRALAVRLLGPAGAILLGALAVTHLTVHSHVGAYLVFFPLTYLLAFRLSAFPFFTTFSLVTGALVLRLAGAYVIPSFVVFDDETGYALQAESVLAAFRAEWSEPWRSNPFGNLTAVLYHVFGNSLHTVKALNACLGVVTAFLLFRFARRVYESERIARASLYLGLFLPPMVFVSSIALKEQLIAFAVVTLLYGFVSPGWKGLLFLCLGSAVLAIFRTSLAIFIIPTTGLFAGYRMFQSSPLSTGLRRLGMVLTVSLLALTAALLLRWTVIQETKAMALISGVDTRGKKTLEASESEFSKWVDLENPLAPRNLLLTPVRALYSPSPLRPLKTPGKEVVLEALALTGLIYVALPYVLLGVLSVRRNRAHWLAVCLYGAIFLTAAYAALTAAPEIFRYRWPGFPIFFLLAVVGWYRSRPPWRHRVLLAWWSSVALFSGVYLL